MQAESLSIFKLETKDYSNLRFSDLDKHESIHELAGEIDNACVFLGNVVLHHFFPKPSDYDNLYNFYCTSRGATKHLIRAGLDGESLISQAEWKEFLENDVPKFTNSPEHYKFFYTFDVMYLISSIQENIHEIPKMLDIVYDTLNKDSILDGQETIEGLSIIQSSESVIAWSLTENVLIKLCSCLDYLSKLAAELTTPPNSFSYATKPSSAKLKHSDVMDRPKIFESWTRDSRIGTIFEEGNVTIKSIKSLRNHIVHTGKLSMKPAIYELKINGAVEDRFMLFPDMYDGKFTEHNGRRLFYSKDKKMNTEIQTLLEDSYTLIIRTIKIIYAEIFVKPACSEAIIDVLIPDLRPTAST